MTTGIPEGKTNKELTFDLSPYIIGGRNDDDSASDGSSYIDAEDVDDDEEFIETFTCFYSGAILLRWQ